MDTISDLKKAGFKSREDIDEWEKAYWLMRLLVDTNRFGALSKDGNRIRRIKDSLLTAFKQLHKNREDDSDQIEIMMSIFEQTLLENVNKSSKKYDSYVALYDEIGSFIQTPRDLFVLAITIQELLIPTNEAVQKVPTQECTAFARKYFKTILDIKREKGLSNIVREWDILTEDIALNRERDIIIELFRRIKSDFSATASGYDVQASEGDMEVILTAVCQEYERRVGQKRKQRAGQDLEGATEFIFKYFNIKTSGGPEHFTAGMEVDNWIKDKKGWFIGISLKRTLRERWKQTYTTETGLYDRYKIKHIIHIINNDFDLSDSKITELGAYRHLFFVADDSNVLQELRHHIAMGKYIFPMSSLISEIRKMIDS
jgi:hypothetical protein